MWDLGIRKDWHNYAPVISNYIPTRNYTIEVTKNVIDVLEEEGVKGESIEAVIWRYIVTIILSFIVVHDDDNR